MHHLIIGGGPAATNAIETIREFDGGASTVTLVCDEPAHSRMALPYWLAGSISEAQTHTGDAAYFAQLGVATRFRPRVVAIDPRAKTVSLDDGSRLAFDKLLIATGSTPVRPPNRRCRSARRRAVVDACRYRAGVATRRSGADRRTQSPRRCWSAPASSASSC